MIRLMDGNSGATLGEITDAQLQYLVDQLEEEFMEDQDYAITPLTLTYFEGQNADPHLLALLRRALGDRDEALIRWARD
jgi:processive 1,2-diacylglycerol beta-glucosyltransferase